MLALGTTTTNKREKIMALLKAHFGYNDTLSPEKKHELIEKAKEKIRQKPPLLTYFKNRIKTLRI